MSDISDDPELDEDEDLDDADGADIIDDSLED